MLTRIILVLAAAGFILALWVVFQGRQSVAAAPPVASPPASPFTRHVAGAGLIEPAGEAVRIGVPVAGLVSAVPAKVGDQVESGAPLIRLDDRVARAEFASAAAAEAAAVAEAAAAKAQVDAAQAEVERLRAAPRAEEVAIREAAVKVAEVAAADARDQYETWKGVTDGRAVPREQIERRRFAAEQAAAAVDAAKAELALAKAGSWASDIAVAEAGVEGARAAAASAASRAAAAAARTSAAKVELERLTVTAPKAGTVLRVSARPGEFAMAGFGAGELMVLGDTATLHIRVDIDENDAWRVKAGAKARAAARGNSDLAVDLSFVRIEPLVVPKRNLTGDSAERVDTRVLQVVFAFTPDPKIPLYVGQQMDVFIEEGAAPSVP